MRVAVLILLVGLSLAGCTDDGRLGNELVVASTEVPPDVDGAQFVARAVQCREQADLEVTAQKAQWDTGTVSVVVKDGAGYLVSGHQRLRAPDVPLREDITGVAGLWSLEVRRSIEMDAPFAVTLRC
jgi:hypothetical protein